MSKLAKQLTLATALTASSISNAYVQEQDNISQPETGISTKELKKQIDQLDSAMGRLKFEKDLLQKNNNFKKDLTIQFDKKVEKTSSILKSDVQSTINGAVVPFSALALAMFVGLWYGARKELTRNAEKKVKKAIKNFEKELEKRINAIDKKNDDQDADITRAKADMIKQGQYSRARTLTTAFMEIAKGGVLLLEHLPPIKKKEKFQKNGILSIACNMASYGAPHAKKLYKTFPEREKIREEKDCLDEDKELLAEYLNNYISCLSTRATPEDMQNVGSVIKTFKEMVRISKENNHSRWPYYDGTIIWAELNANPQTGPDIAAEKIKNLFEEVDSQENLFEDAKDKEEWKKAVLYNIEIYNRLSPKNKVPDFNPS